MEGPRDIRERGSSKSHAAETPIEWYLPIYRWPKSPQRPPDSPLHRSGPPQANTGIPLAFVEKPPQATACEDELAGIEWPIRGVANVAKYAWGKQADHSRRTKFLRCSRSSLLSNVMQRKTESKQAAELGGNGRIRRKLGAQAPL